MKIHCELINESLPDGFETIEYIRFNCDTNLYSVDNGKISKSTSGRSFSAKMRYRDFEILYQSDKNTPQSTQTITESFLSSPVEISSFVNNRQALLFPEVSKLIQQTLASKDADLKDADFVEGDCLALISNKYVLLELPWEDIIKKFTLKKITILRKVVTERKSEAVELSSSPINNFLLAVSNSTDSREGNLYDIRTTSKSEVKQIIDLFFDSTPKYFKVNSFNILWHLNKDAFKEKLKEIDQQYNFLHIIMHGGDEGHLLFENSEIDSYKQIHKIEPSIFIDLLSGKSFLLSFLSFCNSAAHFGRNESIAFNLVENGISKYVIGYRYGVLEKSAKNFSQLFYQKLTTLPKSKDKDIIKVFKDSLLEHKDSGGDIPCLFLSHQ